MQRITVPFEVKAMNDDDQEYFYFEGYASTFGNVDEGGDRVKRGAFTKTVANWSAKKKKLPVLWQHKQDMPLGVYSEMLEDANGLFVKGRLPKSDTFVSGRVIPQMKAGSISDMSIGYYAIEFDYEDGGRVRNLKELELCEVSLVTSPMNAQANITFMKNLDLDNALPVAPEGYIWDETKALENLNGTAEAFLLPALEDDEKSRLPIGDIIEGKLHVVLDALQSAAVVVQSGYKIPEGSAEGLKAALTHYYKRFGKSSPFEEKTCVLVENIELLSERELERALKKGVYFSDSQAKRIVKSVVSARREAQAEPKRDAKLDELNNLFKQIKSI